MASPPAEIAADDQRGEDCEDEEDEARVDEAVVERLHGLGRLDGRECPARDLPMDDVGRDGEMNEDQDGGASGAHL